MPAVFAPDMAQSLRPILRHTAQQLTLLGRIVDLDDFSEHWLGEEGGYHSLGGMDLLELASAVNCLELSLGILAMALHAEWEQTACDRTRWYANAQLTSARALLRELRRWKREHHWREVGLGG